MRNSRLATIRMRTDDLRQTKPIRHMLFWLLGIVFMAHLSHVQAKQENHIFIDIPSQSLEIALQQLRDTAGISLIFNSEQITDKKSSPTKGMMSPRQALDMLLTGTDLTYKEDNGNIWLISSLVEDNSDKKVQSVILPELLIKQVRETSYITEQSSTATRIPAPIKDVPRSIGVVTRNVIEDQKAFRIDEAIRNVSGTFMSSTQGGRAGDFMIRGFRSDLNVFKNGFREDSTYGARASRDTANIESIEVVKGPPSYLYGRSDPGGVINQTTKAPLGHRYFSGEMIFGSYGLIISSDNRYWRAIKSIGKHYLPSERSL